MLSQDVFLEPYLTLKALSCMSRLFEVLPCIECSFAIQVLQHCLAVSALSCLSREILKIYLAMGSSVSCVGVGILFWCGIGVWIGLEAWFGVGVRMVGVSVWMVCMWW